MLHEQNPNRYKANDQRKAVYITERCTKNRSKCHHETDLEHLGVVDGGVLHVCEENGAADVERLQAVVVNKHSGQGYHTLRSLQAVAR